MPLTISPTGIGESMVIIPAMVRLHQHFRDKFPFACSLVFIGPLTGSLLGPLLTKALLENYGLKGALLCLGGISLSMLPIAMVLKAPVFRSTKLSNKRKHLNHDAENDITSNLINAENSCQAVNGKTSENSCKDNQVASHNILRSQTPEMDLPPCNDINLTRSKGSILLMTEALERILSSSRTFMKDAKLFILFVLPCDFCTTFVFISWGIFFVPYAMSVDIDEERAVYFATFGSVGGICARVANTVVLRLRPEWGPQYFVLLASLSSLALFLQPLSASYGYLLTCFFLIGGGLYGMCGLFEAILSLVVDPSTFPTAVSVSYLFKGTAAIFTSFVSGKMV